MLVGMKYLIDIPWVGHQHLTCPLVMAIAKSGVIWYVKVCWFTT